MEPSLTSPSCTSVIISASSLQGLLSCLLFPASRGFCHLRKFPLCSLEFFAPSPGKGLGGARWWFCMCVLIPRGAQIPLPSGMFCTLPHFPLALLTLNADPLPPRRPHTWDPTWICVPLGKGHAPTYMSTKLVCKAPTQFGGGSCVSLQLWPMSVLIWGFHLFAGGEDPRTEGPAVTPWMGQGHGDCHPYTWVGVGPQPHLI